MPVAAVTLIGGRANGKGAAVDTIRQVIVVEYDRGPSENWPGGRKVEFDIYERVNATTFKAVA
jgi:hypothetical protein